METILVRMAQSGQLRGRVTETQLIGLLGQADEQTGQTSAKKGSIVVCPAVSSHITLTISSFNDVGILTKMIGISNSQVYYILKQCFPYLSSVRP